MKSSEFIKSYNANYNNFLGYATKLTKDKSEALDIIQEASIKAYKNISDVDSKKTFKSWMYTIIKNTFINKYTKVVRRRSLLEKIPVTTFDSWKGSAKNEAQSNLEVANILKCVKSIKDIYRQPFFMHYKGYSYNEISDDLDVPVGTVKSRINTARKKMQRLINTSIAA